MNRSNLLVRRALPLGLAALAACQATLGPGAIRRGLPSYNETIDRVLEEQLLLNLVRLKYRDNPLFLDVGAVTAQQTFTGTLGFEADGTDGAGLSPGGTLKLPMSGSYSETPTIVLTPLQGDAFFHRMMSQLPLESMLMLTTSGWSIERVLTLICNRINDVRNAVTAAGPTPEAAPHYRTFQQLAVDLRTLQEDQTLTFALVTQQGQTTLMMELWDKPDWAPVIKRVRDALELDPALNRYYFTSQLNERGHGVIAVQTRSLLSVMFYLSQGIDAPQSDIDAGLVTTTRMPDGKLFDWHQLLDGMFRVQVNESKPDKAFVSVNYRGHWFSIRDDDLNTKATFMLLTELFNAQAGQTAQAGPVLTIPASH